jgi:hypothetical protein
VTRDDAYEFWGADAVERALREEHPDPVTKELALEIQKKGESLSPGAFRAWALAQPWPKFCAIITIVSGAAREEFERLAELEDGDD